MTGIFVEWAKISGSKLLEPRKICESKTKAISVSTGKFSISFRKAAKPPAEAPIATTLGLSIFFIGNILPFANLPQQTP
jgi:hypothetical protein